MPYQTRDAEVEAWVSYVKRSGILDRMQRVYACAIVHHEDEPGNVPFDVEKRYGRRCVVHG